MQDDFNQEQVSYVPGPFRSTTGLHLNQLLINDTYEELGNWPASHLAPALNLQQTSYSMDLSNLPIHRCQPFLFCQVSIQQEDGYPLLFPPIPPTTPKNATSFAFG